MAFSCGRGSRREISLYKGISDRPLGWKPRRNTKLEPDQYSSSTNPKRWDGLAGTKTDWDGLRRDPELWYSNGNCLVHLYNKGRSRRGPSFKIPFEMLLDSRCGPLLDRFLDRDSDQSPLPEASSEDHFKQSGELREYELYIPAPPMAERGQPMLHHISTRNFFAWLFGKPLVGPHLGDALVRLLTSMNEFRSPDVDNVADILHFMEKEGYSDIKNEPDHALAVLYFAEQFRFRDLWIHAFTHSAGMSEMLCGSSEYEYINRVSRAMISRSRFEMDIRLDSCGRSLGTFLEDELSVAHLGLSPGARAHLDRFRSFLQSYYVAKLGYYPPSCIGNGSLTFPKGIYAMMRTELENLYDFLVDKRFTTSGCGSASAQGGICVLQNIQAFDRRHHYTPLPYPLPLLPEVVKENPSRSFSKRLSWVGKPDKMRLDERLITLTALSKASNGHKIELLECSLVKAYRRFEKECIFSCKKADKSNKVTLTDARKVRWIMIYTMLQTLRAATDVPHEVRDTQDVPYNLCVLTAGCPPWKDEKPLQVSSGAHDQFRGGLHTPTEGSTNILNNSPVKDSGASDTIKPDIDYYKLNHRPAAALTLSTSGAPLVPVIPKARRSTVRRAISALGDMPELRHPKPLRSSHHEILVYGYGNGLNNINFNKSSTPTSSRAEDCQEDQPGDSPSSSNSDPPEWSNTNSDGEATPSSPSSSVSDNSPSRRGSNASLEALTEAFSSDMFSSSDSRDNEMVLKHLRPKPLDLPTKAGIYMEVERTLGRKETDNAGEMSDSSFSIAEANPELGEYLGSG